MRPALFPRQIHAVNLSSWARSIVRSSTCGTRIVEGGESSNECESSTCETAGKFETAGSNGARSLGWRKSGSASRQAHGSARGVVMEGAAKETGCGMFAYDHVTTKTGSATGFKSGYGRDDSGHVPSSGFGVYHNLTKSFGFMRREIDVSCQSVGHGGKGGECILSEGSMHFIRKLSCMAFEADLGEDEAVRSRGKAEEREKSMDKTMDEVPGRSSSGDGSSPRGIDQTSAGSSHATEMDNDEKRVSSAAEYFERLTKGLPFCMGNTAGAGRGVFATRDIANGEVIQMAVPIVSHPTLANVGKLCYLCLRELTVSYPSKRQLGRGDGPSSSDEAQTTEEDKSMSDGDGDDVEEQELCSDDSLSSRSSKRSSSSSNGKSSPRTCTSDFHNADKESSLFCCQECESMAESDFYALEKKGDWTEFNAYCRQNALKFPLIAARLACMVISGAVSSTVLKPLCYVELPPPAPSMWLREHAMLFSALESTGASPDSLQFLTPEWYAGVLSRLHLNAFRIEIVSSISPSDYLQAAAAAVRGEQAGSGVFLLPSMYNHDCDPNVHISWEADATAKLEARRDISLGEELRITYVDATMSRDARREHLEWSYGFLCECDRCRDGD